MTLKATEKAAMERVERTMDTVKLAEAWGLGLPEKLRHILINGAWADVREAEADLDRIRLQIAHDVVDAHTRLLDAVDLTKEPL